MAEIIVTSPADIKGWISDGSAIVIDVREIPEYNYEHIAGSTLIPLSSFDADKVPVPPEGKKLVIHCQSGVRCGVASQKLVEAGRNHPIYRMQGGIQGWKFAGGPVERS
jgi:rhodanese-related sulfurtransferase